MSSGPFVVEIHLPFFCWLWNPAFLALTFPMGAIKHADFLGVIFLIWTYFDSTSNSTGKLGAFLPSFGLGPWAMRYSTFFCFISLLTFALRKVRRIWQTESMWGLPRDILMGSWWKWNLILVWPPPHCSLFFLFTLIVSSEHFHCRKKPIIAISDPCWKCDSLWNVFGVTQGQCLSCRSANRMRFAGERRKIRADDCKEERQEMATYSTEENMNGVRGSKRLIDDVEGIIGPQTRMVQLWNWYNCTILHRK